MTGSEALRGGYTLGPSAGEAPAREKLYGNRTSTAGPAPPVDRRGARYLGAPGASDQRARRPRDPREAPARRGRRRFVHCRGPARGTSPPQRGREAHLPLQPGRAGRRDTPVWRWAAGPVRSGGARADPGRVPPPARPGAGWHGDLVADDAAAGAAPRPGWPAGREHGDHSRRLVGRRVHLAADPDVVPHRHGAPAAPRRHDRGSPRPARHPQKELIDRAYRVGEACGLQVWCQDEAGPYQAVPQPGRSWQFVGDPARQPHEYVRGGTAKLLTLFRPATGEVRAEPVDRTPNPVLHRWLRRELAAIVAACPPAPAVPGPGQRWEDWHVTPQPRWWADGL